MTPINNRHFISTDRPSGQPRSLIQTLNYCFGRSWTRDVAAVVSDQAHMTAERAQREPLSLIQFINRCFGLAWNRQAAPRPVSRPVAAQRPQAERAQREPLSLIQLINRCFGLAWNQQAATRPVLPPVAAQRPQAERGQREPTSHPARPTIPAREPSPHFSRSEPFPRPESPFSLGSSHSPSPAAPNPVLHSTHQPTDLNAFPPCTDTSPCPFHDPQSRHFEDLFSAYYIYCNRYPLSHSPRLPRNQPEPIPSHSEAPPLPKSSSTMHLAKDFSSHNPSHKSSSSVLNSFYNAVKEGDILDSFIQERGSKETLSHFLDKAIISNAFGEPQPFLSRSILNGLYILSWENEDCFYRGQLQDGQLHGQGCFSVVDKEDKQILSIEGTFENNQLKSGLVDAGNQRYFEGQFRDGQLTGYGNIHYWPEDSSKLELIYRGPFKSGQPHGVGKLMHCTSEGLQVLQEGTFFHGKLVDVEEEISGESKITYADESENDFTFEYQGQVNSQNFPHGQGALLFLKTVSQIDNTEHSKITRELIIDQEGEFADGELVEGTITYEWRDSKRTATQTVHSGNLSPLCLTHPDGQVCSITPRSKDLVDIAFLNGTGTCTASSDCKAFVYEYEEGEGWEKNLTEYVYEGEFKNGESHGQGKLSINYSLSLNGESQELKVIQEGTFEEKTFIEGTVTYQWKDGRSATRTWHAEELSDLHMTDEEGYIYHLRPDSEDLVNIAFLNGTGTCLSPAENLYTGPFKNGVPDGEGVVSLKDGNKLLVTYKEGEEIERRSLEEASPISKES